MALSSRRCGILCWSSLCSATSNARLGLRSTRAEALSCRWPKLVASGSCGGCVGSSRTSCRCGRGSEWSAHAGIWASSLDPRAGARLGGGPRRSGYGAPGDRRQRRAATRMRCAVQLPRGACDAVLADAGGDSIAALPRGRAPRAQPAAALSWQRAARSALPDLTAHGAPRLRSIVAATLAAGGRAARQMLHSSMQRLKPTAHLRSWRMVPSSRPGGTPAPWCTFRSATGRRRRAARQLPRELRAERSRGTHAKLERCFEAELPTQWVAAASVARIARWGLSVAEVEALSAAARGLSGECALSFLRFSLNTWATGHRLHTAVVPSCLAGCGPHRSDTLAHYVVCPPSSSSGPGLLHIATAAR